MTGTSAVANSKRTTQRVAARAEGVGSLIRPPEVRRRFEALYDGIAVGSPSLLPADRASKLSDFESAADQAVAELARRQIAAGLDVVTDGEIRRATFMSCFYDCLGDVTGVDERPELPLADGRSVAYATDAVPSGRMRKVRDPLAGEVAALRRLDPAVPFKVTLPAASMFLLFGADPPAGYESPREMLDDIVTIVQGLVADAVAAGAGSIQFDALYYPAFDEGNAEKLADTLGLSLEELMALAIDLDRRAAAMVPEHVTLGTHICRGNMLGAGKGVLLDEVAERMFSEIPYERWLIEWTDPTRHGDFSALRFVPEDKIVVLGLVNTKTPELEDEDELVRTIEAASAHLPIEQLALSPQCGFSTVVGHSLTGDEETQWRKLELVGNVADRVWGSA